MYSRVLTASLYGLDGELTWTEVDAETNLPGFFMVGLGSQSVKEARERIRSALENCGYGFPPKRITVNLTPANRKKDGSHYDLPIAVGLLLCLGLITQGKNTPDVSSGSCAFLGELSLDGRVCPVEGVLPMVMGLKKQGIRSVILPEGNLAEASLVEGIDLCPAKTLKQVADHVSGFDPINPRRAADSRADSAEVPDLIDIRGQESVKRAAQIAAAGMHGMLMIGPPGVGKTMIGKRIPGLLPDLSRDEQLEVTRIYSVAGLLKGDHPLITGRPFRAPHHSISQAALVGGGSRPRPGEISLAHKGVLFLDELPEFAPKTLDSLRQPMEDGFSVISRVNARFRYPAGFMLVAAMNPCRCGYWGDPVKKCTCTETDRKKYIGRISGPFLDRIDLQISLGRVVYKDISAGERAAGSSTSDLKEGVLRARKMQEERYRELAVCYNSQLSPSMIEKWCIPDRKGKEILKKAFERWDMSARSYHRILRLSRTIADIDGCEEVRDQHVLEALQYRFPEGYFS